MLALIISLVVGLALLFLTVYVVITLSDLECDFMNATQCCSKLNKWVPTELVVHGLLTVLLFCTFHWYLFLLNVPLMAWQSYRYFSKPSGYIGVYDPAEIHNRSQLKRHMQESMVKLGYHLIFFFIYLYSTIIRLVDD